MQCWAGRAPMKKKQGCRTAAYLGGERVKVLCVFVTALC
jgi:hypothetical protein